MCQPSETRLADGGVQVRVRGEVSKALNRSGLELKFPAPGEIGLPGYVRWHLAGSNATGTEHGIFYAPENFNVSKTAEIENILRRLRAQGYEANFDFTGVAKTVRVVDGVEVRVLDSFKGEIVARIRGTDISHTFTFNESPVHPAGVLESFRARYPKPPVAPLTTQVAGEPPVEPPSPPAEPPPGRPLLSPGAGRIVGGAGRVLGVAGVVGSVLDVKRFGDYLHFVDHKYDPEVEVGTVVVGPARDVWIKTGPGEWRTPAYIEKNGHGAMDMWTNPSLPIGTRRVDDGVTFVLVGPRRWAREDEAYQYLPPVAGGAAPAAAVNTPSPAPPPPPASPQGAITFHFTRPAALTQQVPTQHAGGQQPSRPIRRNPILANQHAALLAQQHAIFAARMAQRATQSAGLASRVQNPAQLGQQAALGTVQAARQAAQGALHRAVVQAGPFHAGTQLAINTDAIRMAAEVSKRGIPVRVPQSIPAPVQLSGVVSGLLANSLQRNAPVVRPDPCLGIVTVRYPDQPGSLVVRQINTCTNQWVR